MKLVLLHNESGMTLGFTKGRIELVHPSKRCSYETFESARRAQRVFAPDCVLMPDSFFDGSPAHVAQADALELDSQLRRTR